MPTIAIVDSLGNETEGAVNNLPTESGAEVVTAFDTKKWRKIINGNVDMIQKKVDQ